MAHHYSHSLLQPIFALGWHRDGYSRALLRDNPMVKVVKLHHLNTHKGIGQLHPCYALLLGHRFCVFLWPSDIEQRIRGTSWSREFSFPAYCNEPAEHRLPIEGEQYTELRDDEAERLISFVAAKAALDGQDKMYIVTDFDPLAKETN